MRPRGRAFRWSLRIVVGLLAIVGAVVVVDSALAYRGPRAAARALAAGTVVYAHNCQACHGARGEGRLLGDGSEAPPLVKPGFLIFFELMPYGMTGFVRDQTAEGIGVMPPFRQALDAMQLDAVAYAIREWNLRAPPERLPR